MRTMSAKDLVDFNRKSDRAKKSFVERIKSNKIELLTDGGGNYWISSISAAVNSYKQNDDGVIDQKINELQEKLANVSHNITKNMYLRNISILKQFKNLNIIRLRPKGELSFLKKSTGNTLLTIKGLQIEVKPSLMYTFEKSGEVGIGGMWFVAKVDGHKIEEVGMLCELFNKFLKGNYSKKYNLNPEYCIAVDLLSGNLVKYSQLENKQVSSILIPTLEEITKLL